MDERIQVYETKMGKTLNALESELTTIRAGRANPHILDKLTAGCKHFCAGGTYDPDPAMGIQHDQSYRESNSLL